MSIDHLTDEQMQEYLDNGDAGLNDAAREHLEHCDRCREAVWQYRQLYSGLKEETGMTLSPQFTSTTMSRIEAVQSHAGRLGLSFVLLWIAGLAASVGAIVYFVDVAVLVEAFRPGLFVGRFLEDSALLAAFTNMYAQFSRPISIMVFASLLLLAVGIVDRVLAKRPAGTTSLSTI